MYWSDLGRRQGRWSHDPRAEWTTKEREAWGPTRGVPWLRRWAPWLVEGGHDKGKVTRVIVFAVRPAVPSPVLFFLSPPPPPFRSALALSLSASAPLTSHPCAMHRWSTRGEKELNVSPRDSRALTVWDPLATPLPRHLSPFTSCDASRPQAGSYVSAVYLYVIWYNA